MNTPIKTLEELHARKQQVKIELELYELRMAENFYASTRPLEGLKNIFSGRKSVQKQEIGIPGMNLGTVIGVASLALRGFMLVKKIARNRKKKS